LGSITGHSYLQGQNYTTEPVKKIDDKLFEPIMNLIESSFKNKEVETLIKETLSTASRSTQESGGLTYQERLQNLFYRLTHELNQDRLSETFKMKVANVAMSLVLPEILKCKEILNISDYTLNQDNIINNHANCNFISSIFRHEVLVVGIESHHVLGVFDVLSYNQGGLYNRRYYKGELVPLKEEDLDKLYKSILTTADGNKFTPLISACANNSLESVRKILNVVKNICEKENNYEFLKKLLSQTDKDGHTPLISACAKNSPELVREILDAVKDMIPKGERAKFLKDLLFAKNKAGHTALRSACFNNNIELVQEIFKSVEMLSSKDDQASLLKKLLSEENQKGYTALIDVCAANKPELVKEIFTAINKIIRDDKEKEEFVTKILKDKNKAGFTAISNANYNAKNGRRECLTALQNGLKECFGEHIPQKINDMVKSYENQNSFLSRYASSDQGRIR
jgi:ankyrin repeat protein